MEMPRPNEKHKALEKFVGKWSGEDKISASQWMAAATKPATLTTRMALDNFFLFMDYEQISGGTVTFCGHGIVGFDQKAGNYTMHWFDNFGVPCPSVGIGKLEKDALTFDFKYPDHKGRTVYKLEGGSLIQRVEMDMDGKGFKPVIEGRYKPTA